jgi:hypothetical protein
LEAISKTTGKSILKVWKEESWLQDKAKALNDAKIADEENKSKISKPTQGSSPKKDFSHIKSDEDVSKLSSAQRAEFMRYQVSVGK